jgi:hypothetical protein
LVFGRFSASRQGVQKQKMFLQKVHLENKKLDAAGRGELQTMLWRGGLKKKKAFWVHFQNCAFELPVVAKRPKKKIPSTTN